MGSWVILGALWTGLAVVLFAQGRWVAAGAVVLVLALVALGLEELSILRRRELGR